VTRAAITGAGGFLGSALARRLAAGGAEISALSRGRANLPGARWRHYDLAAPSIDPSALEGADVVIHSAFGMAGPGPELERLNYDAALRLRDAARKQGARFIFISSMSAHEGAESAYGRAKWAIEKALDAEDAIVRPGLIVGPGGLYARMLGALRAAPVIPLFYGGEQPVQVIGVDDAAEGIGRIAERRAAGTFNLALPQPLTVRELYGRMLAAAGLSRPIVPLPGGAALAAVRLCEKLDLRLPITSENLLGLKHLRRFETAESLARLDLTPAPLEELPWAAGKTA
jgi:NADH dehydrogenase